MGRVVMVLWDSKLEEDIEYTPSHLLAEMPLNFLGLKLEYIDLQSPLPDLKSRKDVIGILSWLPAYYQFPDPEKMIHWANKAIDLGKKYVLIGLYQPVDPNADIPLMNQFWDRLGVYATTSWASLTYDFKVENGAPSLFPFERDLPVPLPTFININVIDPHGKALVKIRSKSNPKLESSVVLTTSKGGFALEEYLIYLFFDGVKYNQKWFVNPFKFFQMAFDLPPYPIPDPSTIAGRRCYFSHIDGDGWNNATLVVDNRGKEAILSSEIILKEIVENSPDLPITIGPIAANLNVAWNGSLKSGEIARKFFSLPHVEMGCHTYSHPFDWRFFKNYTQKKEEPYLSRYPFTTWKSSYFDTLRKNFSRGESFYKLEEKPDSTFSLTSPEAETVQTVGKNLSQRYFTPRAYALKPFNLTFEILGAIDFINQFHPPGKKVEVYQWSGDTLVWKQGIALTQEAGVRNLNGGDPRCDFKYPSYAYVAPLARVLDKEIQVYTCSSNENLYTELWTNNFYGQVTLPTTFERTETPLRIKALNFYYHMYSGEKFPSLYAVIRNLAYIRTQKIAPIPASLYSRFVNGFYSANITQTGLKEWKIENRGALQNFRFDQATYQGVNFNRSKGVMGQRHYQGSLYVYLDDDEHAPIIALQELDKSFPEPIAEIPYLVESRWRCWSLTHNKNSFSFISQGYGLGEMNWRVPEDGFYKISLLTLEGNKLESIKAKAEEGILTWSFSESALDPRKIQVTRQSYE